MPDPTITIKNRKNPPAGHFWVELDDGDGTKTVGSFGPRKGAGTAAASGLVPWTPSDGEFKAGNTLYDDDGEIEDSTASATVPISSEGYAAAMLQIAALKEASAKHQLDYRALGVDPNNCIDVTQNILDKAGRPEKVADFFQTAVLQQSPAGISAMHRAGGRADDAAAVAEFPDMAFPWPPQARSDVDMLPAPAESAPMNYLNSAQVERMIPENLLNSAPYAENLLNAAKGLRAAGY
jgi:hypothetical protein